MYGIFIKFRFISYIFRKDWYCLNRLKFDHMRFANRKYHWITDIGFITIGRRKKNEKANHV